MEEKSFKMNLELFFNNENSLKESVLDNSITIHRAFDFQDKNNVICYEKSVKNITKCNVASKQISHESISNEEFKKQYRKHFHTRMSSKLGHCESSHYGNYNISASIDFIRGPVFIVLAYVTVKGAESPNEEILKNINLYLQEKVPLSINGKITGTTPAKISLNRTNYIMPTKKVLPKWAHVKYCKRLSNFINDNSKLLFEYKWVKLKTGVILVWERYDELINVLTGNKIDPMYIEDSWPAFDTDLLMSVIKICRFDPEPGKDYSDQLAEGLITCIDRKIIQKNILNDRIKSYFSKRLSFVENFEKIRNAKRALNNMGKDIIDILSE